MDTNTETEKLYKILLNSIIKENQKNQNLHSKIEISKNILKTKDQVKFCLDRLLFSLFGLKTKTYHSIEFSGTLLLNNGILTIYSKIGILPVKIQEENFNNFENNFEDLEEIQVNRIIMRCGSGLIYQFKEPGSFFKFSKKKAITESDFEDDELILNISTNLKTISDFNQNREDGKKDLKIDFKVNHDDEVWLEGELKMEDVFELKDLFKKFSKSEISVFNSVQFDLKIEKIHLKLKTVYKENPETLQYIYYIEWIFYDNNILLNYSNSNNFNYIFTSNSSGCCLCSSDLEIQEKVKLLQINDLRLEKYNQNKLRIEGKEVKLSLENIIEINGLFNHDKDDLFDLIHLLWITPSVFRIFEKEEIRIESLQFFEREGDMKSNYVQIKGIENSNGNYGNLEADEIIWIKNDQVIAQGKQVMIKGTSRFQKILINIGQSKFYFF